MPSAAVRHLSPLDRLLVEAQRALEAAGAVLVGQAVVAAAARSPVAQPLPNPGELS